MEGISSGERCSDWYRVIQTLPLETGGQVHTHTPHIYLTSPSSRDDGCDPKSYQCHRHSQHGRPCDAPSLPVGPAEQPHVRCGQLAIVPPHNRVPLVPHIQDFVRDQLRLEEDERPADWVDFDVFQLFLDRNLAAPAVEVYPEFAAVDLGIPFLVVQIQEEAVLA